MIWEYGADAVEGREIDAILHRRGQEGWEAWHMDVRHLPGSRNHPGRTMAYIYFKRQVEPDPDTTVNV